MGSLLPLSITTNCTMKSLLILATVLAVGHSEETKAAVVAPYHYGIPGYYGGVAAPFVGAPLNYAYAPQTAYPYTYAPYAQAYAQVAAPVAAPAPIVAAAPAVIPPVSSQFHAGDEFGNSQYGYSNLNSANTWRAVPALQAAGLGAAAPPARCRPRLRRRRRRGARDLR